MTSILSFLHYYLVNQPYILNFTWIQGQTFASSPLFLALSLLAYLFLTLLFSRVISLPPLSPHITKPITAIHSLFLLLLSIVMAVGAILSINSHTPNLRHIICFPPGTPLSGPLFFWAYVFYLSKFIEFGDTMLIILTKSIQRLTFLHVYHHATVVVMCYVWLNTCQSLFPIGLVTNATVHVVMYGYYLSCAVGVRPKWKRLVTDFQILQFVFSFLVSGLMIWYHFSGGGVGCSGIRGWCFNAGFNATLLFLFADFHSKSYANRNKVSSSDKHKKKL